MRISIHYRTNKIPVSYQMLFVSLFKKALEEENSIYYKKFYQDKKVKEFSFAVLFNNYQMLETEFIINDSINLIIGSPNQEYIIHIYNAITKMKEFRYKQYKLMKENIELIPEKFIFENKAVFHTMSPLCIKDQKGNFLIYSDNNIQKEINYIADKILYNYRGYGLKKLLEFTPINMKKIVVKEEIKEFSQLTGKAIMFVNASIGKFLLKGDTEDLNMLYQAGIGFRRGQGYGMLDILQ